VSTVCFERVRAVVAIAASAFTADQVSLRVKRQQRRRNAWRTAQRAAEVIHHVNGVDQPVDAAVKDLLRQATAAGVALAPTQKHFAFRAWVVIWVPHANATFTRVFWSAPLATTTHTVAAGVAGNNFAITQNRAAVVERYGGHEAVEHDVMSYQRMH
jgi:hypothetical protein